MKILDNTIFDGKLYLKTMVALAVITALQMATAGNAYVFLLPVALAATMTRRLEQMIFWLLVSMLIIIGNDHFLPKSAIFFLAQRALVGVMGLVAFSQVCGRRQNPAVSPFRGMAIYLVYMSIVSATGWNPVISYLKIALFSAIYLTYYSIANLAGQSPRFDERKMRSIVLAVATYLIGGSVALIPFPALGQLTGEEYLTALKSGHEIVSLFKGITNQSQALGPVIAITFAFVFADLIVNVRKANGLYLALLLACPVLIYKTSSRTAMLSLMTSVAATSFCLMKIRGIGRRWRGKVKGVLFALFALAAVAVVAVPSLRESIARFAMKYGAEKSQGVTMEGVMASRQGLLDQQIENLKKNPLLGNGFQVSASMENVKATSWKSYLSAPVEKGLWVTAVIEEGGIVGASIFYVFVLVLCLLLLKRGAYTGLTVFVTLLATNVGEFTLFSMSGCGGYLWLLVFIATAIDATRIKRDNACLAPVPHPPIPARDPFRAMRLRTA